MFLQTVGVTAQLLLDPVSGAVECHLRLTRTVRRFEDDPLRDWSDDVAGVGIVRPSPEGDIGADASREIFFGDFGDSPLGVLAQRFAGVDLVTRDPYVHLPQAPHFIWRGA